MYVDWYVFEEEWYGKAMLGTLPYPTLPYPTLPYPRTQPRTHPHRPAPLNPIPTPTPYPTLPPPHPTQPLPYSCPAIHRLALLYHTLPYPSAVYAGPFRCFGNSVESLPFRLPFRLPTYPDPHHLTQTQPLPPTLPYPHPTPPNPYLTPVLPYTALPCSTIPYPTLPLYM